MFANNIGSTANSKAPSLDPGVVLTLQGEALGELVWAIVEGQIHPSGNPGAC
jgi:hypothetical protein